MGLGGDPDGTMASDATPRGEAQVWVVGLGFQAIDGSIDPP
jgi:hypothetical protein